jgi:hypothetical protein
VFAVSKKSEKSVKEREKRRRKRKKRELKGCKGLCCGSFIKSFMFISHVGVDSGQEHLHLVWTVCCTWLWYHSLPLQATYSSTKI